MTRLAPLFLFIFGCGSPPTLAITHVSVVDVVAGAVDSDQTVVVRGRRIASVGPAAATPAPNGVRVIDGRDKYVIPGLWDLHVHLSASDLPALVQRGITGARDMGGDLEELLTWRRRIEAGELRPVIDRSYPLLEAREAVRYVGTGEARAKVVITA